MQKEVGSQGGEQWEGAYPVSPAVMLERESMQGMYFMLITKPFYGKQIGSFACIFQMILRFIWMSELKGSTVPSSLSSKRCGMLTNHAESKHHSFNLFISRHSTFCNSKCWLDSQFWFENRQYPLRLLAQEMFNFNDNRDRLAQRHFETSEILLNLQKNPNESRKLN